MASKVSGSLIAFTPGQRVLRAIIPFYATSQDQKTAAYFQQKLKEIIQSKESSPTEEQVKILKASDEFFKNILTRWSISDRPPLAIANFERYYLAVRKSLAGFQALTPVSELTGIVEKHSAPLLEKWVTKNKLSKDTYFTHPDFVDFVFQSYLHCHLKRYGDEVMELAGQPWIKVNGLHQRWSTIRDKFFVKKGELFSKANGSNKKWTYLEEGLTEWDPKNWSVARSFKQGPKQEGYSLVLVTNSAPPGKEVWYDSVAERARHTWFRIITPDGKQYSYGLRLHPEDLNLRQPLAGTWGFVGSPDTDEFTPTERFETTVPITEDRAKNIQEKMEDYMRNGYYFNHIDGNCTGFGADVLKMAGVDVDCKIHVSEGMWKLLLPKWFREPLGKFGKIIHNRFPNSLEPAINSISKALGHIVFLTIFSLLGGWKTHNPKPREGGGKRDLTRARPFFTSLKDCVDPEKMLLPSTLRLQEWQKKQGERTKYINS